MAIKLQVNGKALSLEVDSATPLLWVLRDNLGLSGTKYGCGMGLCGACTVHVDGQAMRSCTLPLGSLEGREITTIEGLGDTHPLQRAWVEHSVSQCGYCQSGQVMAAAALLAQNPRPSEAQVSSTMSGNICRCGTYGRIKQAILAVAGADERSGSDE
ncbi:MAG: (2Fe-2S)-binding protein [Parahaliea sp.]